MYESALAIELGLRGTVFERQARFSVEYKGQEVGEGRMALLVERFSYLKATDPAPLTALACQGPALVPNALPSAARKLVALAVGPIQKTSLRPLT